MELTVKKLTQLGGCYEAVLFIHDRLYGKLVVTEQHCKKFIELFVPNEADKLTPWQSITYWLVLRYYRPHRPWDGYYGVDIWHALRHIPTKKRPAFLCQCLESLVTGDLWTDEINKMVGR